jgi:hypothetical protein
MAPVRQFILVSLTYALARVSEPWTARQTRQLSYVAEYTSDICHIARAANVVADTLSRPPGHAAVEKPPSAATCVKAPSGSQVVAQQGGKLNSSTPSLPGVAANVADVQPATGVSFHKMAANQARCPSTLQAAKSSSLSVRSVQVEGASLLCDVARGITRPLVPVEDRPAMTWHIQAYVLQDGCCLHVLYGKAWAKTWQPCAARASSVRGARFTSSQQLLCRSFLCWHASSPTCTWTWWGLYQLLQRGTCTCSPSSTGQPGGLKQSP